MFLEDSCTGFGEHPEHETEQCTLLLLFLVKIMERLLHGLAKLLPKPLWIEVEKFLVERASCFWFIHERSFSKELCF